MEGQPRARPPPQDPERNAPGVFFCQLDCFMEVSLIVWYVSRVNFLTKIIHE
jgi:hypothetical protein